VLVPAVPLAFTLTGVFIVLAGLTAAGLLTRSARGVGRRLGVAALVVLAGIGVLVWRAVVNDSRSTLVTAGVKIGVALVVVGLGVWVAHAHGQPARPTVSRSITMRASPATVYDLMAHMERMGEWSPENAGGKWRGGATQAAPGAKFVGSNRHGWRRWRTLALVDVAEPPRRIEFRVRGMGVLVSRWTYTIAATPDGASLTQTWEDLRPAVMRRISGPVIGVSDRNEFNASLMEQTLERIKTAAETTSTAPDDEGQTAS
jgi:hypothetical protein